MKTPALFKEYIWLVNTIYKAKRISLSGINAKWIRTEMSEGVGIARTTFNRHKDAIEEMFGIIIDCDRRGGYKYYIANEEVLEENTVQNWMLSTISVNNVISESLSLQHRILLENIPSEKGFLQQIIEAMKKNQRIAIQYKRYRSPSSNRFSIDPYCIKLFRQRWYVLGHFTNGNFGTFSFDRIESIELLDEKFKVDKGFDAKDFFSECFGIVQGVDVPAERVVLRAYNDEYYYVRDLPLHHSQKEIVRGTDYTDFEYYVRPTSDFIAHLLSRSSQIQVLEPEWLADKVYEMHLDAIKLYEKE